MGVCTITLPPPPITYEAVDLGLPSGTKWASQNVGARKPSDYGLYFQWGDTQGYTAEQVGTGDGKKEFTRKDYKWNPSGDWKTFTKYATTGATLELEDDAAHVHMGGSWHMPTTAQIKELINTENTTTAKTTNEGVSGITFTSKKDASKSIFIPAAGKASYGSIQDLYFSHVWSSMMETYNIIYANVLIDSGLTYYDRFYGYSVRGVIG